MSIFATFITTVYSSILVFTECFLLNYSKQRQLTNFRKLIPKSKLSLSEKIHNEQSVDNAKKHSKKINLSGLIIKYPEIPKLISLATYHNKYVDNVNEYLTV